MSIGVTRKVTLGIAGEASWGTEAGSADYVLPNTSITWNPEQRKAANTSMLGTDYANSTYKNTVRLFNFSFTTKIDENILPLLLAQKFDIASTTATDEASVYEHTLTYSSRNETGENQSYTLFWGDDDIADKTAAGCLFESVNFTFEQEGFITAEISGVGKFPTATGVSNSVDTTLREFVGRNASFTWGDYDDSYASKNLLTATLNHTFGINDDGTKFVLGDQDVARLYTGTGGVNFNAEVSALYSSDDVYDDYRNNTEKQARITAEDTDRFVTGSTSDTNPKVQFTYPIAHISDWSQGTDPNALRTEDFTLQPVDHPKETDAPAKIVIINSVESY